MDNKAAVTVGVLALLAALLLVFYGFRRVRLRLTKRRFEEFLEGYFNGDIGLDQLASRAREGAGRRFTVSPEFQSLVQAAFQRAAETKLVSAAHSLDVEKSLMTALAAVKTEFGLPDRYQNEGWKAGRE
jgi:hypothetical protein